jgi:DNA-binding transcriptional regulator GbsR (MarR family)
MDEILSAIDEESTFDKKIFDIIMQSKNKIDIKKKMDELFTRVKKSKEFQEQIKEFDEKTMKFFETEPVK